MSSTSTTERSEYYFIYPSVSAIMSTIGSTLILYIIRKSKTGLLSIYHRIMFGMSIADILGSVAVVFTTIPTPKDTTEEELQDANLLFNGPMLGNEHTCRAQGFLFSFGIPTACTYCATLCLYYACSVVLQMREDTIRKYLEPFFHGLPIVYGIFFATIPVVFKFRNETGKFCVPFPTTCTNEEDPETGEQVQLCDDSVADFYMSIFKFMLVSNISMVILCLSLVVLKVMRQDRIVRREIENNPDVSLNLICRHLHGRVACTQAFSYIMVFTITVSGPVLHALTTDNNGLSDDLRHILTPLQGFFTFLIFVGHKVYNHKWVDGKRTFCSALRSIFCSPFSDPIHIAKISIVDMHQREARQNEIDEAFKAANEENEEEKDEEPMPRLPVENADVSIPSFGVSFEDEHDKYDDHDLSYFNSQGDSLKTSEKSITNRSLFNSEYSNTTSRSMQLSGQVSSAGSVSQEEGVDLYAVVRQRVQERIEREMENIKSSATRRHKKKRRNVDASNSLQLSDQVSSTGVISETDKQSYGEGRSSGGIVEFYAMIRQRAQKRAGGEQNTSNSMQLSDQMSSTGDISQPPGQSSCAGAISQLSDQVSSNGTSSQ